jgi:alpha-L-fucosidase
MRIRNVAAGLVLGVGLAVAVAPARAEETREQRDARLAWWLEARFGMFIHWDMSSLAGTEISWSRKGTKPLDITGHKAGVVEDPAYDNLYKRFNPGKFDAAAWMRLARDAGMKYVVFTAKHHGGFCMWDTKLTDYSIMSTPFKRDVVKELADACRQAGLRFGLYYSQRDWHHPDYGIGDNRKYVDYMNGQVRELLTRYAPVDVIWWDSYGKGDLVNFWGIGGTFDLVRQLNPAIVMNNRMAVLGAYNRQPAPYLGDHDTPEQRLGEFQNTRPWESCMTVVHCADGGGWSYRPDGKARSRAECIRSLASCVTGDGNLLLDVGPDATGVIPEDQAVRLREMGEWLKACGPAVYGTRGGPYRNGRWGGSTHKSNTVYLHVFAWNGGRLELPALKAKVLKTANLSDPQAAPALEQTAETVVLTLDAARQDPVDTVLELTLDGPARNEMENGRPIEVAGGRAGAPVKPAADGTLALGADSAALKGGTIRLEERAGVANIGYWTNAGENVSWKAQVAKAGACAVELTYACPADCAGSEVEVTVGGASVAGKVEATAGWDDYRTLTLGTLTVEAAGPATVTLKATRKPGAAVMNLRQVRLVPK